MFKGPAALTSGSTIIAGGTSTFTTGTVTIASAVLTTADVNGGTIDGASIGATTTASGAFTTLAASGTLTMSANTNIVVSGTGELIGLSATPSGATAAASKGYVDAQVLASGAEAVVDVATITGEVFTQPAFSGKRLFLLNADTHSGTGTMTLDLSSGTDVSNGDTWTIVWAVPQGTGTSTLGIKVDLGASKLYDANGTLNRYITLPNVGSSVRLVRHGSLVWHIIGGSGGIPSTS